MKPTVIDLFAGVGGLSLGFEKAGFDVVLANEYDSSIAEAYRKNHRKKANPENPNPAYAHNQNGSELL